MRASPSFPMPDTLNKKITKTKRVETPAYRVKRSKRIGVELIGPMPNTLGDIVFGMGKNEREIRDLARLMNLAFEAGACYAHAVTNLSETQVNAVRLMFVE